MESDSDSSMGGGFLADDGNEEDEFVDGYDAEAAKKANAARGGSLTVGQLEPVQVLRDVFGHSRFRGLQSAIVSAVLAREKDLFVIMPTGGGKSLCYQVSLYI